MTTPHTPEDRLLDGLLRRAETASSRMPDAEHLDDETLALFVEGLLPTGERPAVIEHLADCVTCRQLVATLWSSEAREGESPAEPQAAPSRERVLSRRALKLAVAVAAMLLVAVGVWWRGTQSNMLAEQRTYQQSQQLLAASDFEQARRVMAQARQQGIRSDRLLNLNSQAVRQLPGSLALETAGTLTDFGYDFDGTLSRGSSPSTGLREAAALLAEAKTEPLELLLNRGHLRLSQNDFEAANSDFQRATQTAPDQPLSWLGLGLAEFARQNFEAAESAFRQCLSLAPEHVPARVNRAMTLEELDRFDEARTEWQLVLSKSPPEAVRRRIEQHLKALK